MTPLEEWEKLWSRCRDDILEFCRLMGFEPWSQQRDFLLAAQNLTLGKGDKGKLKRLIAKSGQGLGKTKALVILGLWRHLRSFGTLTVVVAPTERQMKEVFFAELKRTIMQGPPVLKELVSWTATTLVVAGYDQWRMVGVAASNPENAAGWHHETMTILLEEISGMDDNIVDAFLGTASQEDNLIVAIGNPTKLEGHLYDAFNAEKEIADEVWPHRFTLSKLQLSKERPKIAHPNNIEGIRLQFGEESDFWRVRVLGEFPASSGESIMNRLDLDRAASTPQWQAIREAVNPRIRRISIDFGGHGPNGDENAIFARQGNAVVRTYFGQEPTFVALEKAFEIQEELRWRDQTVLYIVDSVGVGQGMLHHLDVAKKRYMPYGSHHSGDMEHANLDSKSWFKAKELLATEICSIPDDKKLISQLASRIFGLAPDNRILVESKKSYKKRTKRKSPDRGDGFVQLFANDDFDLGGQQVIR